MQIQFNSHPSTPHSQEKPLIVAQAEALFKGCNACGIHYVPYSEILEKLKKIETPEKREQVVRLIIDLTERDLCLIDFGVLDFIIDNPESITVPTLKIVKKLFADSWEKRHLRLDWLTWISKLCGTYSLSEEQLKAFETLNVKMVEETEEKKRVISKILFGNQESIRHFAFDLANENLELYQWMRAIIKENPTLELLYQQWHPKKEEFYSAFASLNTYSQEVNKLYTPINYFPDPKKPFPNNLIPRHEPASKGMRKNTKMALQCFLDAKFDSNQAFAPFQHSLEFTLNKNDYKVSDSGMISKNDQEAVQLIFNEIGIINKKMLSSILSGHRWEAITENVGKPIVHIPDDYWSNWEDVDVGMYKDFHLMLCQVVKSIKEFSRGSVSILDFGGGTGSLANTILNQVGVKDYILLEKNEKEIRKAKEILGDRASVVPTDIVQDSILYCDAAKTLPLEANSIDVAIGSGILTHHVLKNREDALIALKKICSLIKPYGFILLTGATDSYISGKDLEAEGFEIISTSLPNSIKQFYIASKIEQ